MKAIVCDKYGRPESLQLTDVPKPVPKANEVLVKVKAAAINDYDWCMARGKPILYRLIFGILKPKNPIPGMEVAGVVEIAGSDVLQFVEGDAVFGDISDYGFGSFAEYLCIDARALIKKPEYISFNEAATISHASLLAYQGLHDLGKIASNQKVLINGAGGGVGLFALQFAKALNCEVTGVDSGQKLQSMISLGYDHVIDYKKIDFTRSNKKYDLILDCKTNRSPFAYLKALKQEGKYVTVGGQTGRLLQLVFCKGLIHQLYKKKVGLLMLKPNQGIEHILKLFSQNKLRTEIDGPYALEETPQRIRYFGEGLHTGKVLIAVNN